MEESCGEVLVKSQKPETNVHVVYTKTQEKIENKYTSIFVQWRNIYL